MNTAEKERQKYEQMWDVPAYRKFSPGEKLVTEAIRELDIKSGDNLIDFGCGTGRPALAFQKAGVHVTAVDHVVNCLDDDVLNRLNFIQANLWQLPPNLIADFGFCTDVMEHIPTEHVHDVLSEIKRTTRRGAFFQIATFPDGMGRHIGETLHLTVRHPSWWEETLSKHWNAITIRGDRNCIAVVT
jgi:ubiquinone/menaquinone biosynthesis C-methylase UbiE